jgi:hypothetical protein
MNWNLPRIAVRTGLVAFTAAFVLVAALAMTGTPAYSQDKPTTPQTERGQMAPTAPTASPARTNEVPKWLVGRWVGKQGTGQDVVLVVTEKDGQFTWERALNGRLLKDNAAANGTVDVKMLGAMQAFELTGAYVPGGAYTGQVHYSLTGTDGHLTGGVIGSSGMAVPVELNKQ